MSVAVVRNDENENLELPPDREGIQRKRCRLHQRLNGQHLQGNLAVLAVRCMQVPITPQNMFVVSAELDEVDLATIHLCKET